MAPSGPAQPSPPPSAEHAERLHVHPQPPTPRLTSIPQEMATLHILLLYSVPFKTHFGRVLLCFYPHLGGGPSSLLLTCPLPHSADRCSPACAGRGSRVSGLLYPKCNFVLTQNDSGLFVIKQKEFL